MGSVFASNGKNVVVVPVENAVPAVIAFENVLTGAGAAGELETESVIITGIGMDMETNMQFSMSLRNVVYVYALGDRMGRVIVSGMGFSGLCGNSTEATGFAAVANFYKKRRASISPQPIVLNVGDVTLSAFLTSMRAEASNDIPGTFKFVLTLSTVMEASSQERSA